MPFSFKNKLVITVSSRALFDLEAENRLFNLNGLKRYRQYQRANERKLLQKGTAFTLVEKLLRLNKIFSSELTEVVLVSSNDADTAVRIFNSIEKYSLPILRAAFTNGAPKFKYLQAFNSKLYLSCSTQDVKDAINNGFAAAHVIHKPSSTLVNGHNDDELRIGFDFDGVLADDSAEAVYQRKDLKAFVSHEKRLAKTSHKPGPIYEFVQEIGRLRQIAEEHSDKQHPKIRTAIITARDARVHKRFVTTCREQGLIIDETFFLGGAEKAPFINSFAPDIYFDDQLKHLEPAKNVATAFVPYGIINREIR
ncbi:MAG: hypothetical protein KCHDKBKB_00993 [Elusimicrobia bacterium]|nr:hypothetical protein [Elusimicrobiota bacterium]